MSTYDEIRLVGIGGFGYHGVLAQEREEGQPFHADLTLYVDASKAARTDDLADTVSYADVAKAVQEVIEGEPANLLETVAARIADAALAFGVAKVDVTLHKPQAPVGVPFTDVQVRLTRSAPTGAAAGPAGPGLQELPSPPGADAPPLPAPAPPAPAPPAPAPPAAVAAADLLADNEGVPADARAEDDALDAAPSAPVPVVLGLGGNVGDVRQTMREAVGDLARTAGITVSGVAPLARTAAVTHDNAVAQDDFLNTVVFAETTLSPRDLLSAVQRIEDDHGRVRLGRWGDRTLDIDIVTYGDLSSSAPDLTLPHPHASQRAFVLLPWAQHDPEAVLPGEGGGNVADLAERAPDRCGVRWLALDWLEDGRDPTTEAPAVAEDREPAGEEPAGDGPSAPPAGDGPPAPSAPPVPGPPPVAEWLAAGPEVDQEFDDAPPALPVPPPAELPAHLADPAPVPDELPEPEPHRAQPEENPEGAVEWLPEETPAPPLSAPPQWHRIRRDE